LDCLKGGLAIMTQDVQSPTEEPSCDERLERLKRDIAEGLASGPAVPWDPDEIKRAGRAHLKTADKKPPGADGQ
jgi:hypothetical protein